MNLHNVLVIYSLLKGGFWETLVECEREVTVEAFKIHQYQNQSKTILEILIINQLYIREFRTSWK